VSGDLLLIFLVWYGLTRFALEGFRVDNWTFFGIPTARIVTLGFILVGLLGLIYRHGPGRPPELAADLLPDPAAEPTSEDEEAAFWADDDATAGDEGDETDEDELAEDQPPDADGDGEGEPPDDASESEPPDDDGDDPANRPRLG
jgi:hypothetical protein